LFDETAAAPTLLPVSIMQEPARRTHAESLPPACGSTLNADIQIAFNDCTVRIGSSADMKMLRAVLALLRQ